MISQLKTWTKVLQVLFALLAGTNCDFWAPPLPTESEMEKGLVVMYPGSFNTRTEMIWFNEALREAGIDQAIEVVQWDSPMAHFFMPTYTETLRPWAKTEAARIASYKSAHPDCPVTLLGYSAGALPTILVSEEMPAESKINCVIMLSPAVWSGYDLNPMLENTTQGAVVYYSPRENFTINAALIVGAADGSRSDLAAVLGFETHNEKLLQVKWEPVMAETGNTGDHLDYFWNIPWIREYVAPWVAQFH